MDTYTWAKLNYFVNNFIYVDEDKNNISKTLAVKEKNTQHFSEYIQEFVTDILKEFEITRDK